ncbi:MAG: peptidoglycan-binding protein [Sphingomonas sp.]|nr:MAG: peptidoglycan-binding protein [Sphingomonas sp.]
MITISASVGRLGVNRPDDVSKVQDLLHRAGMNPGPVDHIAGPRTIAAINGYQQHILRAPDGRVDANGLTLHRLNAAITRAAPPRSPSRIQPSQVQQAPPPSRVAALAPSSKAMRTDWTGDSEAWPQDKKLASLDPVFRRQIEPILSQLRTEGFKPKIIFAWRSVAKQLVLHRQGRTKVLFSFHNAQTPQGIPNALAVDVVDERWGWNEPDCHVFFKALGRIGKMHGLVWGGDWTSFRDWAHLQGRQNSALRQVKRESGL